MQICRDLVYDPAFAPVTTGDLFIPDKLRPNAPPVLLIHGGGWSSMRRQDVVGIADWLAETGRIVFSIDYRLTGQAPWPACGDDCLKAAEFLRTGDLPIPGKRDRIGVIGGSAGGHLALMTGMRFPATQWTISISGIADPIPYLLASKGVFNAFFGYRITLENLIEAFPISLLDKPDLPPILCTHMLTDDVVPLASALNFIEAAERRGIKIDSELYPAAPGVTGHGIWIPGSSPHRLLPELEAKMGAWIDAHEG